MATTSVAKEETTVAVNRDTHSTDMKTSVVTSTGDTKTTCAQFSSLVKEEKKEKEEIIAQTKTLTKTKTMKDKEGTTVLMMVLSSGVVVMIVAVALAVFRSFVLF